MEPSNSLCCGEAEAEILRDYHEWWGRTHFEGRNPAPQPSSLERQHFPLLLQNDYMVADKSDGARFVLFLTRAAGREVAVLVDRKLKLFQIPVAASKSFFAGSMFDGELVDANGFHVFLVFDAVAVKGVYVGEESLLSRLALVRNTFDLEGSPTQSAEQAAALAKRGKVVCGGSAHGLSFRPKPCYVMRQLDTLLRQMPTLPYAVDGLVFTPVHAAICTGTHATAFKFKWKHTIDVEVASDGEFLVGKGGAPETAVQRMPLASLGAVFRLDDELKLRIVSGAASARGAVLELLLTLLPDGEVRLSLLRLRSDKVHPNSAAVVLRTLVNLNEGISTDELLELARDAAEQQLCRERR